MVFRMQTVLALCLMADVGTVSAEPPEEEMFNFVVVGDTGGVAWGEWWKASSAWVGMINEINQLSPDFVVVGGDMVSGPRDDEASIRKLWDYWDRAVDKLEPHLVQVVGNHDVWNEQSRRIYAERYGKSYYSFDHKGSHFVAFDSQLFAGKDEDTLFDEQLDWLKRDLAVNKDARHTFVFMHRPMWDKPGVQWEERIHPLLARYGVDYVFAGHAHKYEDCGVRDGVQYTISGGDVDVSLAASPRGRLAGRADAT